MPIHFEDRKLAKRLLSGDERAFLRFFDENFPRLYRFARARLRDDPEAARDIAQAAMSRGLQRIRSYRGEAALFTWLCTICRHELADWARRNARHAEHLVLVEDYPEVRAAIESLGVPGAEGPHELVRRAEAARLIQVALDNLPARYGDALEWKYIEGCSVREIGGRLGIGTEAAQSVLARAKRAFREVFGTLAESVFAEIIRENTES